MERTQKSAAVSQISTNIDDIQSRSSLRDSGRTQSHPTSPTSYYPDQPPPDRRTVDDWMSAFPRTFSDVNGGAMEELMSVILRYLEEVDLAAMNHQRAIDIHEVHEYRQRLSVLKDGDRDLDRRLAKAPRVREQFVSNLIALVLVLSTGIKLFRPQSQHGLFEDTNRVVEQASSTASLHLNPPATCLPINTLEFLHATKNEIKSRMENLYSLLPTARHLVEDLEENEPRQIGDDKRPPFDPSMLGERECQNAERLRSSITPANESLGSSHDADISRRRCSTSSSSSKKQSYGPSDSSDIPTIFSAPGSLSRVHPVTDTATSNSPSEVNKTSSEPTKSKSTRASSSCRKCRTTLGDPTEFENHSRHTHSIKSCYKRVVVRFRKALMGHSIDLDPEQNVKVWHRDGQFEKIVIALIDTGADENFIAESLVKELDLEIKPIPPKSFDLFHGTFETSQLVLPTWKFRKGLKKHMDFPFYVIPKIPDDISMVLGNIARLDLGIGLGSRKALIGHAAREDNSTREQQKQRGVQQAHDTTARQTKIREEHEARHAEMVRKIAAANAAKNRKSENPTSQKGANKSGGDR